VQRVDGRTDWPLGKPLQARVRQREHDVGVDRADLPAQRAAQLRLQVEQDQGDTEASGERRQPGHAADDRRAERDAVGGQLDRGGGHWCAVRRVHRLVPREVLLARALRLLHRAHRLEQRADVDPALVEGDEHLPGHRVDLGPADAAHPGQGAPDV
jgi:hypothetical protein